jgi:hypothetical protein
MTRSFVRRCVLNLLRWFNSSWTWWRGYRLHGVWLHGVWLHGVWLHGMCHCDAFGGSRLRNLVWG